MIRETIVKHLKKYPKSEKYGLTSEIRKSMFQTIRLILYANKMSNKLHVLILGKAIVNIVIVIIW